MQTRRTFLAAASLSLAALAVGCATPAVDPGVFVPAPMGSVYAFHRVSSGSFGTFDGPVVWTLTPGDWQGQSAALLKSAVGTQVIDLQSHLQLGSLDPTGRPSMVFEPGVGYRSPMRVGQEWSSQHTVTMPQRNVSTPLTVTYKVEAYEEVTVPAGTFKAYRVRFTDSYGETTLAWSAPSLSITTVKRIQDRPATHPQGAGHLEGVLTSMKRP